MSIYPDRKNGKLTGRFRVEVQHEGSRARGRAGSLRETDGQGTFCPSIIVRRWGDVPIAQRSL